VPRHGGGPGQRVQISNYDIVLRKNNEYQKRLVQMQQNSNTPKKRVGQRDGGGGQSQQQLPKKMYLQNQYSYNGGDDNYSPSQHAKRRQAQ